MNKRLCSSVYQLFDGIIMQTQNTRWCQFNGYACKKVSRPQVRNGVHYAAVNKQMARAGVYAGRVELFINNYIFMVLGIF